ncbi:MAG: redoxin domain-containing protein [Gemmatimonadales bacterium]
MEAYRDQYAKLFNRGKGVAVIGISADDDTVQANWAREKSFPVYFASDPDREVGTKYDVNYPLPLKMEKRVLFVIGPDGKVAHIMRPFRELADTSYVELGDAVARAMKGNKP